MDRILQDLRGLPRPRRSDISRGITGFRPKSYLFLGQDEATLNLLQSLFDKARPLAAGQISEALGALKVPR